MIVKNIAGRQYSVRIKKYLYEIWGKLYKSWRNAQVIKGPESSSILSTSSTTAPKHAGVDHIKEKLM